MAELSEADYGTAIYRSTDPVKNLKIKVYLERVTSASVIPLAVAGDNKGGMRVNLKDFSEKTDGEFGGQKDADEHIFSWQEKIFCQREINLYSNPANCEGVLERKYHQEVLALREKGRPTKRLFSYVQHDAFTSEEERYFTTSPDEKPTLLAEQMTSVRHRKTNVQRNREGELLVPQMNIVDYEPSEELKKQNRFMSVPVRTMYIMADCTPDGKEPTTADEAVLCTIKVDNNGTLIIQPDFNNGRRAYRLKSSALGSDVFDFTIEHASEQLSKQEEERERKMYKELYSRHSEYLTSMVGYDFEMPPPDVLRMVLCGEIMYAKNFEYDDLYIHYFVELPRGWIPAGWQQLSGVTQTCRSKMEGRDNVCYFGFPFEIDLMYRQDMYKKNDQELLQLPQLFIEVLSLDSWQRYRTEGYGYITFPFKPGMSTVEINCWRPLGHSAVSELRRFFIGGSPELEDPTYTSTPSAFEGTHLSKFGFRTLSTGSVTLRLYSAQQSHAFLTDTSTKKKVGLLFHKLGQTSSAMNIWNALNAFAKAKKRMIAARENLRKDFIETLKPYQTDDNY